MNRCTRSLYAPIVALLVMGLWANRAQAQTTVNAGGFVVEFWNNSDGAFTIPTDAADDVAAGDVGTWSNAEMQSIVRALEYWTETLNLPPANADSPILRVVKDESEPGNNATAFSGQFNDDPVTGGDVNTYSRLVDDTNPNRPFGIDGYVIFYPGHVGNNVANPLNTYDTTQTTQLTDTGFNLQKTAMHEFGHLLGFTGANQAHVDSTTGDGGFANGTQALLVHGGSGVPLEPGGRGHTNLNFHNLTRAEPFGDGFRNISAFAPGELAVYSDMGYTGGVNANLVLNEHFGYLGDLALPLYQNGTGTLETLNNDFTTDNDYAYGLFLHADNRNVLLNGEIDLDGFAATGIRLSADDATGLTGNRITIGSSGVLDLSGDEGIGVLVSAGANNVLIHRGTITTTGAGSTGVYLGIGRNSLSGNFQVTSRDYQDYLVEQLDITGDISANSGNGNAIFIDQFVAVNEINIMSGASLIGDIEINALSGAANNNAGVNVSFDRPTITFGRTPDANGAATGVGDAAFSFTFNGDIFGTTDPDLDFFEGSSLFTGNLELNDVLVQAGTATFGATSVVDASIVTVQNGSFVVNSNDFDTQFYTMLDGLTDVDGNLNAVVSANILGGEANVNGTLISAQVNLGQFGTLSGDGVVQSTGDLQGAGTIAPGNSIGTLTIMGDYDGLNTANYDIELDPAGQTPGVHSDLIDVTGEATIDAGTVNVIDLPGTFAVASQYVFLQGAPLTVVNPVTVNESIVDRRIIQAFNATQYSLLMARDVDYGTLGETSNQIRFGNYLETVELDPDVQGLRDLLDLIPLDDDVRNAFDQLGGEVYASHLTSRLNSDSIFLDIVGGVTHNVTDPCATFEDAELFAGGWNVSYGMTGREYGNGNAHRTESDYGGTALGYSELLSENAFAGFVYGYEHLDTSVESLRSDVESEVHRAGLFGEYRNGAGFVRTLVVGGYADSNSRRAIVIANPFVTTALTPGASFDGWLASGDIEAGTCVPAGSSTVQPIIGLRYLYVAQKDFTERNGNVANLTVDDADVDALRSRLGARLYCPILGTGTRFSFDTLWQYDLLGEPQGLTTAHLAVADAADFQIDGVGVGRNRFILSPGIEHTSGAVKLFARYRAELNDQFYRQGGEGGLEIGW